MSEAMDHLNIPQEALRQNIFDWIRMLNLSGDSSCSADALVEEVEAGLKRWAGGRKATKK
jgi:hypothetical protein